MNYSQANNQKGLCRHCTEPVKSGHTACEHHLEVARTKAKDRFKHRHSNNLCVRCGKPRSLGHIHCPEHLIYSNKATLKTKNNRRPLGMCLNCGKIAQSGFNLCQQCHILNLNAGHNTTYSLKDQAYMAYGGYVCRCCGENRDWALTLDHINNDGAAHRKSMSSGSSVIYRWLKDNDYPSIIQVLCANCQLGKLRNNGICPHQSESTNE